VVKLVSVASGLMFAKLVDHKVELVSSRYRRHARDQSIPAVEDSFVQTSSCACKTGTYVVTVEFSLKTVTGVLRAFVHF
jgi:hypothetical protein